MDDRRRHAPDVDAEESRAELAAKRELNLRPAGDHAAPTISSPPHDFVMSAPVSTQSLCMRLRRGDDGACTNRKPTLTQGISIPMLIHRARPLCSATSSMRGLMLVAAVLLAVGCSMFKTDKSLFPESTYSEIGADEIRLSQAATPFPGLTLPSGTVVRFENGRIRHVKVVAEVKFDSISLPPDSELLFDAAGSHLALAFVTLGHDAQYGALPFKAGDQISFDEHKNPSWVKLRGEHRFAGKSYEDATELTLKDGRVTKARTQSQLDAEVEARNAESTRNYNSCMNQCAPLGQGTAYSNCVAHCHY